MINTSLSHESQYFNELRMPLVSLARGKPKRVLEIGCANGQSLVYFKSRGAEQVVGIEISQESADIARTHVEIDHVIVGNIETLDLSALENSFDLVVAGHVFEHLVDPWTTLMRIKSCLRVGGQLIGAIPNVRH